MIFSLANFVFFRPSSLGWRCSSFAALCANRDGKLLGNNNNLERSKQKSKGYCELPYIKPGRLWPVGGYSRRVTFRSFSLGTRRLEHYYSSAHDELSWFYCFISDNPWTCSWTADSHFIPVKESRLLNIDLSRNWNSVHLALCWTVSASSRSWMVFSWRIQTVYLRCYRHSHTHLIIRLLYKNLLPGEKIFSSRFVNRSQARRATMSNRKRRKHGKIKAKGKECGIFCVYPGWFIYCVLDSSNRNGKRQCQWKLYFWRSWLFSVRCQGINNISASAGQSHRICAAHGEVSKST